MMLLPVLSLGVGCRRPPAPPVSVPPDTALEDLARATAARGAERLEAVRHARAWTGRAMALAAKLSERVPDRAELVASLLEADAALERAIGGAR